MVKKFAVRILCIALIATTGLFSFGCQHSYEKVTPDGGSTSSTTKKESVDTVKADVPDYHIEVTTKDLIDTGNMNVNYVADNKDMKFYQTSSDKMTSVYISGVNIGLTVATTDLNNPDIGYGTYTEWFQQIAAMNANTIKVFSEQPPQFYQALLDYNESADNPLYLLQGLWFSEEFMYDPADCWDENGVVKTAFEKAVTEGVDIVHGNCSGITYGENADADYSADVSKWCIGYVLGLEWYYSFVENSNTHTDKSSYTGNYLKTESGSTPFEAFLAEIGDELITHETESYKHQTPVSFLNWSTTDNLKHSNEPYPEEDQVAVDTEKIVVSGKYYAGLFAAIDVYPYYPEMINYQKEYIDYKDDLTGEQNNFKAYLKDLVKSYSVPMLVAEFGVPTSRGLASESVLGYNQGKITEEQQGQYDSKMIVDIASAGCAGAALFAWQDEWFKQTWNTYRYAPDNAEQRTPNVQSAEQNYGILAMVAGDKTACLIDGKTDDWSDTDVISKTKNCTISAKYDEAYLYLYVKFKGDNTFDNSQVVVPVSTLGIGSKKSTEYGVSFNKNADALVVIDGKKDSTVLTDEYYDYFYYRYGVENQYFTLPDAFGKKNSGSYGEVKQFVTGEIVLPDTQETIAPIINNAGALKYGISDPESEKYNSLSDIYANSKGDVVEVRVAWNLLNVLNSTIGTAYNDFNKDGEVTASTFEDIFIGGDVITSKTSKINLSSIGFKVKPLSHFHTRLKNSYQYIQSTLKMLHSK